MNWGHIIHGGACNCVNICVHIWGEGDDFTATDVAANPQA